MPSRCTKCGKIHPDNARYLLEKGCDCGSRFFFFVKDSSLDQSEKEIIRLSQKEISEIEKDVREIVAEYETGEDGEERPDEDETVILDVEAVRVIKPGKYRIDLTNLFSQRPIVIRTGGGKYKIDLATTMYRLKKRG